MNTDFGEMLALGFLGGNLRNLRTITLSCHLQAAETSAEVEKKLRALDDEWSAAAGAKDIDKVVSYYADDVVVAGPNAASATTKQAIHDSWKEMLTAPGAAISWKASKVEVAKSGEMAYIHGTYEYSMTDASGKPVKDRGKYGEIFKKQAAGSWKVVFDMWNSDLPTNQASAGKG
ncbi:hypothetical protein BH20VER3_BH20VER3_11650 [soil metagenome]